MVSHHKLLGKIGEGGMGVVYKALDTKLNRHVAIKFLPGQLTSDAERRTRFAREAQAAAALSHSNIAVIHEVGEHEGAPFIVMEYLEGQSLRARVADHALSTREWLELSLQIAEGLHHAHQRGIVHRDLKPDNVLVTTEGQVKILDFGLAKLLDPEALPEGADKDVHTKMDTISKELTVAGKVFGTIHYMSPEQARGDSVDQRSDLFSLGIILYQMASGKLPFSGKSEVETLHGILKEEPPPVTSVAADAPPEVERVVRKAMEKDPELRYQHADDLASDLRALQRDLESGRVSTATAAAAVSKDPSAPWHRKAGLFGLLAVIVAVTFIVLRRDGSTPVVPDARAGERAVGVMGFENLSDPEDRENLSRVLMGLVTTDLAETGGLRVVSSSKVLAALRQVGNAGDVGFDAAAAPEAARIAGAQVMLVGQVNQVAERLILAAELVDVDTGNALGSLKHEAANSSELFTLADAIADGVRAQLGVQGGSHERAFDLASSLTKSPVAYRHYVAGELALHHVDYASAEESFSRALLEDSTFAMARYRLGVAQAWLGNVDTSLETFETALAHGKNLPVHWRVVIQGFRDFTAGDYREAYEPVNALSESGSDIPDVHYVLGEILFHADLYLDMVRAAESLERAMELDPTYQIVAQHLFEAYSHMDDALAMERLIAVLRAKHPTSEAAVLGEAMLLCGQQRYDDFLAKHERSPSQEDHAWNTTMTLATAHLMARNWDQARTHAEKLFQSSAPTPATLVGRDVMATMDLFHGRFAAAFEAWDAFITSVKSQRNTADRIIAQRHQERSRILLLTGDVAGALDALPEIEGSPNGLVYFLQGEVLFSAGRHEEGHEVLTAQRDMAGKSHSPEAAFWVRMLSAVSFLAQDEPERAIREIEACRRMAPGHRFLRAESLLLARALAKDGQTAGAIDAYREFLAPPYLMPMDLTVDDITVLYELAKLEENVGDRAAALDHYRQYLEHWGNADLPVVNVPIARTRVAALEAGL